MAVQLNSTIPLTYTPIAAGTALRLFRTRCTYNLLGWAPDGNSAEYQQLPNVGRRSNWIGVENQRGINVEDIPAFGKLYAPFKMNVKKQEYLLDFGWYFWSSYTEAIGPNPVTSALFEQSGTFSSGTASINISVQTPSIGDPWQAGSTGIGRGTMTFNTTPDTFDGCSGGSGLWTADLGSFGYPYEYLAGNYTEHYEEDGIIGASGRSWSAGWVGVGFFDNIPVYALPHTQLVMQMTFNFFVFKL